MEVTPREWAFVDETIRDFKKNIELLAEHSDKNTEIEQHLTFWKIFLGTLALEAYEAIAALVRAEKLRAALMLGRALMEYHIKLRYYIIQAEPIIAGWKKNPEKPARFFIKQVEAIKDWQNEDAKMAAHLSLRLTMLSEVDRAEVARTLEQKETLYDRDFRHMCEQVAKEDKDVWDLCYAQFKFQSMFLHGDQAAISDVVKFEGRHLIVHFDSPSITPIVCLAEASWFFKEMMASFGRVSGMSYGAVRAERLFLELLAPALHC